LCGLINIAITNVGYILAAQALIAP